MRRNDHAKVSICHKTTYITHNKVHQSPKIGKNKRNGFQIVRNRQKKRVELFVQIK